MSILNILLLYLLFFTLYLFILCIYIFIFIFIYLYYVYVLFVVFLFALLYVFCFKEKFEKYWRGLARPKSQDPPTADSGMLRRTRPDRRQGTDARFAVRLVQALQGVLIVREYKHTAHTHKIDCRQFWGFVGGVNLSGRVVERSLTQKLPLLRAKGVHNGYYVHVLAQPMLDRIAAKQWICVVFTTKRRVNNDI